VLTLYSYCTHTVLTLYSYCTHYTVLILYSLYCTDTVLTLAAKVAAIEAKGRSTTSTADATNKGAKDGVMKTVSLESQVGCSD
jgi:hypothetical protein